MTRLPLGREELHAHIEHLHRLAEETKVDMLECQQRIAALQRRLDNLHTQLQQSEIRQDFPGPSTDPAMLPEGPSRHGRGRWRATKRES